MSIPKYIFEIAAPSISGSLDTLQNVVYVVTVREEPPSPGPFIGPAVIIIDYTRRTTVTSLNNSSELVNLSISSGSFKDIIIEYTSITKNLEYFSTNFRFFPTFIGIFPEVTVRLDIPVSATDTLIRLTSILPPVPPTLPPVPPTLPPVPPSKIYTLLPNAAIEVGLSKEFTSLTTKLDPNKLNDFTVQLLSTNTEETSDLTDSGTNKYRITEMSIRAYELLIKYKRTFSTTGPNSIATSVEIEILATQENSSVPPISILHTKVVPVKIPPGDGFSTDFSFTSDITTLAGKLIYRAERSNKNIYYLNFTYSKSTAQRVIAPPNTNFSISAATSNLLTAKPSIRQLTINFTTDSFGGNLAEVIVGIKDTKRYPNGYPVKLVARNQNVKVLDYQDGKFTTLYTRRPNFTKTLMGTGDYDLSRIESVKTQFSIDSDLNTFYTDVVSYATLKYALSGLINERFTTRVLYRDQNDTFLQDLAASDFSELSSKFDSYSGFEMYFRYSPTAA